MIPEPLATPAMKRLIQHIGTDLLRIQSASDEADGFTLATTNRGALIMALIQMIQDPQLDQDLQVQAGLMLARGGDLVPLVAPSSVPNRNPWCGSGSRKDV